MTLRVMRGFDHENNYIDLATNGVAVAADGSSYPTRVAGRFGGGALQFGYQGGAAANSGYSFPLAGGTVVASGSPLYCGGAAENPGLIFGVRSPGGGMHCGIEITSTAITAYRFGGENLVQTPFTVGGTNIGSVTYTWPSSGWLYVECEFIVAGGTGGSVVVRLGGSGTPILNVTGVNTLGDTSSGNSGMAYLYTGTGHDRGTYLGPNPSLDDMYCCDSAGSANNSFLGERQIVTLFPTSNGTVQFTPLTGSNWQEVSETTFDGDTSYNYAGSSGLSDILNHGTLSSSFSTINGVQLTVGARKDSSGTADVANVLVSGTHTVDGTSLVCTTSYQYQCDIFEQDPNTSAAWTVSGVNSAQIGYTRTV
jgi:hypothetical protein